MVTIQREREEGRGTFPIKGWFLTKGFLEMKILNLPWDKLTNDRISDFAICQQENQKEY